MIARHASNTAFAFIEEFAAIRLKTRVILMALGIFLSAFLGAGTGIVGAFSGVPGLSIFAAIGGVIGFFTIPDMRRLLGRLAFGGKANP